jgi:very-short-patch-repair endonuclease
VLDFYCKEARLAIELDGGQHGEQRQQAHDTERTAGLEERGIRVLRFWNHVVLKDIDAVLESIYEALQDPHPTPLPRGEGVDPATDTRHEPKNVQDP